MVISKSELTDAVREGVDALNNIQVAHIDVRSAAIAGQKFLNSLAVIDPIEFNNVTDGEEVVVEVPEPTVMAEDIEVNDPIDVGSEEQELLNNQKEEE